jgi:hypothetical protein
MARTSSKKSSGKKQVVVEEQAQQQTGNSSIKLRVDRSGVHSTYANAFRPHATTEEIILDLGLNQLLQPFNPGQTPAEQGESEILFEVTSRIILNYYTAKRLAMSLGQMIRQYEHQFGELKLNAAERTKAA